MRLGPAFWMTSNPLSGRSRVKKRAFNLASTPILGLMVRLGEIMGPLVKIVIGVKIAIHYLLLPI